MKTLKCELCGSTDIVKQDGVFVCQQCGAKYSPEEAKQLMSENSDVEEVVEKAPTKKKKTLDELYSLARQAVKSDDRVAAETCYKSLQTKDPDNWEPAFYVSFYQLANCKLGERISALQSFNEGLCYIITDKVSDSCPDKESRKKASIEIVEQTEKHIDEIVKDANGLYPHVLDQDELDETIKACVLCYITLGDGLEMTFPNGEMKDYSVPLLKKAIKTFVDMLNVTGTASIAAQNGGVYRALPKQIDEIKKYEPSYITPPLLGASSYKSPQSTSSNNSGCYVATAVYGSYDCPQVWTLRRFRDYTLAETWYGRAFVKTYYAISPTLVKWFGETTWFKKIWRVPLDKLVSRLQNKGVEDTPYNDKLW